MLTQVNITDSIGRRLGGHFAKSRRRAPRVGLAGGRNIRYSLAERLAARTVKGASCWEIQGCRVGPNGYGQIALGDGSKRLVYAHRAAWLVAFGHMPNYRVLHRCDNPRCVNPAHLFLGTQAENVRDCSRKGRRNAFGRQKLHEPDVLDIRDRAACGELQKAIAADYGVARNTVSQIVNGITWQHLLPHRLFQQDGRQPQVGGRTAAGLGPADHQPLKPLDLSGR